MARNLVTVSQVVNDFILTLEGDDYANNASDTLIHNYALRGVRELGFDLLQRVRSLKLSVGANNTVDLPDDFVDLVKIGIVGSDGLVHVLGENKNINYLKKIVMEMEFLIEKILRPGLLRVVFLELMTLLSFQTTSIKTT